MVATSPIFTECLKKFLIEGIKAIKKKEYRYLKLSCNGNLIFAPPTKCVPKNDYYIFKIYSISLFIPVILCIHVRIAVVVIFSLTTLRC